MASVAAIVAIGVDGEARYEGQRPEPHRGVESLTPGSRFDATIGFPPMHRRKPVGRGRKDFADLVIAQREGGDRGKLRKHRHPRAAGRSRVGLSTPGLATITAT